MNRLECMRILELDSNDATNDEIRAAYKKIALKTHPDKLMNMDEAERQEKEEHFKKVSAAYNKLINGTNNPLEEILGEFSSFNSEEDVMDFFQNTMTDLASEIYTKYNKNKAGSSGGKFGNIFKTFSMFSDFVPTTAKEGGFNIFDMYKDPNEDNDDLDDESDNIININLKCNYSDVMLQKIKNIDIIIGEHHKKIDVECARYPQQTIFIDEQEIRINMSFKPRDDCYHKQHKNGMIDLFRYIYISPYEYCKGKINKIFEHYNGEVNVRINGDKDIIVPDGGLFGGNLVLKVIVKMPDKKKIKSELTEDEYKTFLALLRKISKSI